MATAADCLYEFAGGPTCFGDFTAQDLATCFADEMDLDVNDIDKNMTSNAIGVMDQIKGSAMSCLDPYRQCIVDETKKAVQNLPGCLRTTAVDLAKCFAENALECSASCGAAAVTNTVVNGNGPLRNPYANLPSFFLPTCKGIQKHLLWPACDTMSCCSECWPELAKTAECIVNDALELDLFKECKDFTCQGSAVAAATATKQTGGGNRALSFFNCCDNATEAVFDECSTLAPGLDLNGDDTAKDALAAGRELFARSKFLECLIDESKVLADKVANCTDVTLPPDGSTTSAPTTAPTQDSDNSSAAIGSAWTACSLVVAAMAGTVALLL